MQLELPATIVSVTHHLVSYNFTQKSNATIQWMDSLWAHKTKVPLPARSCVSSAYCGDGALNMAGSITVLGVGH